MKELQADQIVSLHRERMAREGGDGRVISEATLLQAVFRANLIGEPVSRAATVFYLLVAYPAFREGNGATAREIAHLTLTEEDFGIDPADRPLLDQLGNAIVDFSAEPEDVEAWFATHAKKCS
jgi:hypothetical protein